jgi:hypothetical protein
MESLDDRLRGAVDELAGFDVTAPGLPRRPRRGLVVGAAALLLVGGFAVSRLVRGSGDSTISITTEAPTTTSTSAASTTSMPGSSLTTVPVTVPSVTTSASPLVPGAPSNPYWEILPSPGLSERSFPLVRAVGDRVLVAGGQKRRDFGLPADLTDGRLLTADGSAWTAVPNAPVPVGSTDVAEWTGSELLVLTADGTFLSFDPAAPAWTVLPKSSVIGRTGVASAWSGKELLIAGGYDPPPAGELTDIPKAHLDGSAYSPATGKWRSLPALPSGSTGPSGVSTMIGSTWFVENGSKAAHFVRYDTVANRWSSDTTAEPETAFLPAGPDSLLINFNTGAVFAFDAARNGFVANGDRTSMIFGGNNLARIWKVGDTLVGDTGPGYTNGRGTMFREHGGAWHSLDIPIASGNDTFPVLTSSGAFIAAGGTDAARLRSNIDRTIGVRGCRLADFSVSVVQPGPSAVEFTNVSSTACTVDAAPPTNVEFRVGGSWAVAPVAQGVPLEASSGAGGLIEPGAKAAVGLYGGVYCDSPKKADAIRFGLFGETVTVEAAVTACWVIGPIVAVVQRPDLLPEPQRS